MGSIYRGMCRAVVGALGSARFRRFLPALLDSSLANPRKILCGIAADFLLFALGEVSGIPGRGIMQFQTVASPSAAFRGSRSFSASRADGR